jgi:MFS family permease
MQDQGAEDENNIPRRASLQAEKATSLPNNKTADPTDPTATSKPDQHDHSTAASAPQPSEPTTWAKAAQIIASFFFYMNSWAMPNMFGVFQAYYAEVLLPSHSPSQIAWIGSMQGFLLLFVATLAGPAIDMGYVRHLAVLGTFLMFFGLIMTSIGTEYYQLILAQGLVVGVGAGCLFLPSIAILPQWISQKRSGVALGVVATGSNGGGIVYSIMFHEIITYNTFGWAVRAIAFITLGTNIIGTALLKYRNPLPQRRRALVDMSMWKEGYYVALCASAFVVLMGLYIPIFFIQSFYASVSSASTALTFWLLPILMAGSLPGRLVPNILAASHVGNLNMLAIMVFLCGLFSFCWMAIGKGDTGGIIVFALIYGFTSGATVSLLPPVIVTTAPDMRNLGTRMGMVLTTGSFGVLVGNPIAGAILTGSSYTGLQAFVGAVLFIAAAGLLLTKMLKIGGMSARQTMIKELVQRKV